jgi:hypothetical protein
MVVVPSIPEFNIGREEGTVWIVSLCPHGVAGLWVWRPVADAKRHVLSIEPSSTILDYVRWVAP